VASATRNKLRRRARRRQGFVHVSLGHHDGAIVLRGTGQVQVLLSRDEPTESQPAFWLTLLAWLFAENEDAAERREIIGQDFIADMREKLKENENAADQPMAEEAGVVQEDCSE
jgi:hypothetical protein